MSKRKRNPEPEELEEQTVEEETQPVDEEPADEPGEPMSKDTKMILLALAAVAGFMIYKKMKKPTTIVIDSVNQPGMPNILDVQPGQYQEMTA